MFLIRTAFWLSLVVIFLPTGELQGEKAINASDALSAAQSTYGDFSKFCQRNASACETGGVLISSFGQKARYGAQMVYKYLDEKFGEDENASIKQPITPGNS